MKLNACASSYKYCACSDNDTNNGFDYAATKSNCTSIKTRYLRWFHENNGVKGRYYCKTLDSSNYPWNNCKWKRECNNGHPENCWGKVHW
ncbi:hypothetical protein COCCADRAFT_35840 [Bipolaris zeicola 26-R-13]|uniref:Uncharacterized protein n=1 Tax=Cochliobolus carbonum (strain 26-R-13) TaxID=930089 RepID=W6YAA6_COCC2|nr:uncharacterized protein COCCADRAFT_35840 [Bipolaris zeicola 26-R-13]EUC34480.1 hypothetical protein COCCADRAFT_35840 [Bipolaris zeicola 26-R-13]